MGDRHGYHGCQARHAAPDCPGCAGWSMAHRARPARRTKPARQVGGDLAAHAYRVYHADRDSRAHPADRHTAGIHTVARHGLAVAAPASDYRCRRCKAPADPVDPVDPVGLAVPAHRAHKAGRDFVGAAARAARDAVDAARGPVMAVAVADAAAADRHDCRGDTACCPVPGRHATDSDGAAATRVGRHPNSQVRRRCVRRGAAPGSPRP